MEKPNITPTPWRVIREATSRVSQYIRADDSHGTKIVKGPIKDAQKEIDFKAIVTAVNCTYGANINPEKIQEVIEALKQVRNHMTAHIPEKIFTQVDEALNNIKYK